MINTRIALTNLGKYNEGELIYTWLDLPATDEKIGQAFKDIGVANNTAYEEYFISDYETDISGLKIGKYDNILELNEKIEEVSYLQNYELEELEAIMEATGYDIEEAMDIHSKCCFVYYSGINSFEELAEMFAYEGCFGNIPENLENYIDYEAMGRDLQYDYTITNNGVIRIA